MNNTPGYSTSRPLNIAVGVEVENKPLHYQQDHFVYQWVNKLVYDRLFDVGDNGQILPALATSWQLCGNSIEVVLREQVQFHNGDEFDADHLVAFWEECMEQPFCRGYSIWSLIDSIDINGTHLVTINCKQNVQDTYLVHMLANIDASICCPDCINEIIGTGSYYVDSNSTNLTLKYCQSWHGDVTHQTINFVYQPNVLSRVSGVDEDDYDVTHHYLGACHTAVDSTYCHQKFSENWWTVMCRVGEYEGLARALYHSIDRLNIAIQLGEESIFTSDQLPQYIQHNMQHYDHDLANARYILQGDSSQPMQEPSEGYSEDNHATIDLYTLPLGETIANMIALQAVDAYIDVNVIVVDQVADLANCDFVLCPVPPVITTHQLYHWLHSEGGNNIMCYDSMDYVIEQLEDSWTDYNTYIQTLSSTYQDICTYMPVCPIFPALVTVYHDPAKSFGDSFSVLYTDFANAQSANTRDLQSIAVTTSPTKTNYFASDDFNPTGMVVEATFLDGTTETLHNNSLNCNIVALQNGQGRVTISYTESGITKSTNVPITICVGNGEYNTVSSNPNQAYLEGGNGAGSYKVNVRTGRFNFTKPLLSFGGNLMPLDLSISYNVDRADTNAIGNNPTYMPKGWKLNYQQYIVPQDNAYIYIDGQYNCYKFAKAVGSDNIYFESTGSGLILDTSTNTITDGGAIKLTFNNNGLLTAITQNYGEEVSTTMEYSIDKLTKIKDGMGREIILTYGSDSVTISYVNNTVTLTINATNTLASITDSLGMVSNYIYGANGCFRATDNNVECLEYSRYDSSFRRIKSSVNGIATSMTTLSVGNPSIVKVYSNTHDTDSEYVKSQYSFNGDNVIDFTGNNTPSQDSLPYKVYNSQGTYTVQCSTHQHFDGQAGYTWNDVEYYPLLPLAETDSDNKPIDFTMADIIAAKQSSNRVWYNNKRALVISVDDEQNDNIPNQINDILGTNCFVSVTVRGNEAIALTKYTVSTTGFRQAQINSDGEETSYTQYNSNGQTKFQKDTFGNITQYVYNSYGNITNTNIKYNGQTHFITHQSCLFSNDGKYLTNVTTNDGASISTVSYDYNAAGVLTSVTTPQGTIDYTYASTKDGQDTISSGSSTNTTQYTNGMVSSMGHGDSPYTYHYDNVNRLSAVKVNNVPMVSYGYSGNSVTTTYGNGYDATVQHDKYGRPIALKEGDIVKAQYIYGNSNATANSSSKLTKVVDNYANVIYDYVYDDNNKLVQVTKSNDNTNSTSMFSYEYLGGLLTKSIATDQDWHTYYVYDSNYRIVASNIKTSATNSQILWSSGHEYDQQNRMQSISFATEYACHRASIEYLGNRPCKVNYSATNGAEQKYWQTEYYTYDNAGNIKTITGDNSVEYVYDSLGRLVQEDNRKLNATYFYSYDASGNLIYNSKYAYKNYENPRMLKYCKKYEYSNSWKDQLTSIKDNDNNVLYTFAYDNAGNPTTYKGRPLTWTRGRLLKSYDRNDAVYPMTFKYNANGIRIQKQQLFNSHGETTTYTLDGTNILKETKVKSGMSGSYTYTQEYIYGHQGLIGFYSSSIKYLYGKNIQGDITDIYDRIGNCVARYTYDAWGNHKVCNPDGSVNTSSDFIGNINPFRYRGYYYDVETGLYYLQSRYFDPETGRFINADTIDYLDPSTLGGLNLYSYCNNNPIMYYDPSGHILDVVLDVGFLIWGIVDFVCDPSWENLGWVAVDLAFMLIPFATGGSKIIKGGSKLGSMADLANTMNKLDNIKHSSHLITIGQSMNRVYSTADVLGTATYKGFNSYQNWSSFMKFSKKWSVGRIGAEVVGKIQNMTWLANHLRNGCNVIDIGWDLARKMQFLDYVTSGYMWESIFLNFWQYRNFWKSIQLY